MRRAALSLLLWTAAGCGCGDDESHGDGDADSDSDSDSDTGTGEPTPCAPEVVIESIDRVIDPKLSGEPGTSLVVTLSEGASPAEGTVYHLAVTVEGPAGPVVTLAEEDVRLGERTLEWDGRDANGAAVDPGEYTVGGALSCTDDEVTFAQTVHVVRLGVAEVRFLGGTGQRLPLLYHRYGGVSGSLYPPPADAADLVRGSDVLEEASLDLPDGSPRPFDAPWTDLESPPTGDLDMPELDHYNLPVAVSAGDQPEVEIVLGADAISATGAPVSVGWPLAELPIRPHPVGWSLSVAGQAGIAPGEAVYAVADAPIAAGVAKTAYVLHTEFEYQDAGTWRPVRGFEESTHTVYTLVGESTVMPGRGDEEPYMAWVAAVDAVTTKVAGASADPDAVAAQVVRLVFDDLGLRYDTDTGASYYTSYPGWDFSGASVAFDAFLARDYGDVVNCSDCASLVSTYANMVGCDLRYNIIGYNFALNFIRAIGTDAFTNDPFGTGFAGGFSYHAVTSPDDARSIYDATLLLDGDESPESAPHVEQVVDGVDGAYYLEHLSPQNPRYEYDEKTDLD